MKARTALAIGSLAAQAAAFYVWRARPWHLRWGTTDEEVRAQLPGDEFIRPDAPMHSIHAVTIDAPAEDVWSWLVQIGQDRGGFYSYSWLENLAGCHLHNANRIIPEFQHVQVGDTVSLHPKAPRLRVLRVDPGRALVLEGWGAFVIRPIDSRRCRLIARSGGEFVPDLGPVGNFLYHRVLFEPAHFVMERKMLLGIKERAERLAREGRQPVVRAVS